MECGGRHGGKGSLSAALNVMVAVARPLLPRLARLCTLAWCEAYVPRDELSEQEAEEQVESGEEGEKRGKVGKRNGQRATENRAQKTVSVTLLEVACCSRPCHARDSAHSEGVRCGVMQSQVWQLLWCDACTCCACSKARVAALLDS